MSGRSNHTSPLSGLIERSFVLTLAKPEDAQPYTHTVPLFMAKHFSSGHLWFSKANLDIYSLTAIYFALFKAPSDPASDAEPSRWSSFVYPTSDHPIALDVTLHTKNVILTGVCSGVNGPVTSYSSSLRISLGSRDQVFVMIGFPSTEQWPAMGASVAMSLTGELSPYIPHR
jgi:hypothetical protein